MHDDLEALERLNSLLDVVPGQQECRDFVFHARRRIRAGSELPEGWRNHLGNLLIEIGNLHRFDADSEMGSYR